MVRFLNCVDLVSSNIKLTCTTTIVFISALLDEVEHVIKNQLFLLALDHVCKMALHGEQNHVKIMWLL